LTIIHNDRDIFQISELIEKRFIAEGRRKKEEGRRKKEEGRCNTSNSFSD
jgi:hypothetical protein